MLNINGITCNIDKSDRTNRIVFGVILLLGALLGLGSWFFFIVALIMIVEGVIGWCGIPIATAKIKEFMNKSKAPK